MAEITIKDLHEDIVRLRREIEYIKTHMIDVDVILTREEEGRLDESLSDYKSGKAISLEDFEEDNTILITDVDKRERAYDLQEKTNLPEIDGISLA